MSNSLIHIIINLATGFLLFKFSFIPSIPLLALFILFTIIIDIDHIPYFLIKYKKQNLKQIIKIWKNHYKKKLPGFYIFHSPEFNTLILVLSFFNHIILLLFISNLIHITLDLAVQSKFPKEWSIIYNLSKLQNPHPPYQ